MKGAATLAFVVLASVSCGGQAPAASSTQSPPPASAPVSTPETSGAGITPAPSSPSPASPSPTSSAKPTKAGPPPFTAKVTRIARDRLPYSWRPGCPVSYRDLRLVTMTYWGWDDRAHTGELVVRKTVTGDIVTAFRKLYAMRYPIRQMRLVDVYKGDDFDSIDADNTSAFNCRPATGSSNWSNHAYGEAVDVNPRENPYVTASGGTAHANAKKYDHRPMRGKGVINPGDRVVRTFAAVGWGWGGAWSGTKDFQHFSRNGR
ncbi:M15 family metallopeptidase [Nonomuraea sp. 3-1Str]|uniref:M15 family metallopeptidase n=1 Tax=Nonomuraea sp. 3-1Str TaxID=2929801 RepID=UPI002860B11C|nr:M15 family metallopeptidase [Nonomuraea sp. 3-1Str]MDR8407865.1 M15 family metallopeptidase [Nonomuraea sp. 3-1Str]